ncbi:glycosyltransferase family 2 protein [Ferruginibacter sp. SUN002]|uniref:glycosyltransferase family 2 protein n=1 Tax=Ferruginibacter sp. SUN002 TaxID=2937789 RepID=UPI003D35F1E8
MTEKPLVSVLMTAYNREKYIGAAIESVLASTYANFEIIITDDGSKDKTLEIVKEYTAKDQRVKLFINEVNLGDYPNRNKAASHAQGKYLKYVDADDLIYPWGLELLVNMMEQFPDAGWGLCSIEQDVSQKFPIQLSPAETYRYHYYKWGIFAKAPLSSIIKKDVFDAVGGFANYRMVGDFEMWNKLAQKFPVVLMPHGIVWYREHDDQESNHQRKFSSLYAKLGVDYLRHSDCPLSKEDAQQIISMRKKMFVKKIISSLLKLKFNLAVDNYRILKEHF